MTDMEKLANDMCSLFGKDATVEITRTIYSFHQAGVKEERARIVAYLKAKGGCVWAAYDIENGAHVEPEKTEAE